MRKSMRIAAAILAAVMVVGMLTGCGGKVGGLTGIRVADGEKKTPRVAMECAYASYSWTQPDDSNGTVSTAESNEYAYGYDVMMVEKISEELGYDLEIVHLDWDSPILAIQVGKMDCVTAGQSITPERLEVVDFSEPYYYATIVTLVKKGSKYADAKSVADLAGATCTSQRSTVWYDIRLSQIADANILAATANAPDMLMSLQADKCGLVVTDQPTGKGALVACPNFELLEFDGAENDSQVTDEEINIGISMKKGNTELKTAIDGVLSKMTKDDSPKMMDGAIAVQSLAN